MTHQYWEQPDMGTLRHFYWLLHEGLNHGDPDVRAEIIMNSTVCVRFPQYVFNARIHFSIHWWILR